MQLPKHIEKYYGQSKSEDIQLEEQENQVNKEKDPLEGLEDELSSLGKKT